MTVASPRPDVDIPDVSLSEHVLGKAARWGARPAIVDAADGRSLSFAEVETGARRLARALLQRGWSRGEVFAVVAPNAIEFPVIMHGVMLAAGVLTTANPRSGSPELQAQLRDAGARALLTLPELLPALAPVAAAAGVRELYTLGPAPGADDLRELIAAGGPEATADVDPEHDLAALMYSSGTSGRPKGVMLSHRNMVALLAQSSGENGPDDRLLVVLPFFHIFGLQGSVNRPLCEGMQTVVMPRYDFPGLLRSVERHRITVLNLVPPIVQALATSPLVDHHDLSSLRRILVGAAPLDARLQQAVAARLGCRVEQGYGMTETSQGIACVAASHPAAAQVKPGACGVLMPNMQARIVDPTTGATLPPGRDGEIRVRGPNVMRGYWRDPEATREAFDADGWLRTGDVGRFDHEGYLYLTDRLKELIKVKGHQVAPALLEGLLMSHPAVADCAVIGIPDARCGEVPRAYVLPRDGAAATPAAIMDFVAAQVAPHQRLRELHLVDAIPRSPSGKVLRRLLRDTAG